MSREIPLSSHLSTVISFFASFAALLSIVRNSVSSSNCYLPDDSSTAKETRSLRRVAALSSSSPSNDRRPFRTSRSKIGGSFVNCDACFTEIARPAIFPPVSLRSPKNGNASEAVDRVADNLQPRYPNTTAFVSRAM